jgi:hypothetical protein
MNRRLAWLGCIALAASLAAQETPATRVRPGRGNAVMLNGFFGGGEWDDAREVDLGDGYRLLVKHDRRSLFLSIRFPAKVRHSGCELYLADATGIASYHVSSALGRRTWRKSAWSEYAWQPDSWSANLIQTIVEDGKTKVLEPEGFEYQIDRSNFEGHPVRIRIELRRPAAVFPKGTSDTKSDGWLTLDW